MSERAIDQKLVVRVQQGDNKAFDLLVLKYQLRLSKLVSRFLSNQSDVPDVVQESFIKAYRALPNFRGESAFYTWLYRIAINTAKNHLVSQSRKSPANSIDVQDAEDYGASEWLKEYASPEREALADELKSTIYMAIDDLPSDLREAITLRRRVILTRSSRGPASAIAAPPATTGPALNDFAEPFSIALSTSPFVKRPSLPVP